MTEQRKGVYIGFFTSAFPDDEVELHGVEGREELSRLFSFELLLVRRSGAWSADDLDLVMRTPCAIGMGQRAGDVVHGILSSIELVQETKEATATYRATLVPNVWLLTLNRRSAIYQATTIPKMVESLLQSYGLAPDKDFDIRVAPSDKVPEREYVVQYEESDWDFIQRWLEHEGYFYWFVHEKEGEKLIIADENGDTTAIADPSSVPYRDRNNLAASDFAASIWDWRLTQRRVSARVALLDYNYRTPTKMLVVKRDIDKDRGFGNIVVYGEHFKDPKQGETLAQVTAERIGCTRRVFRGLTDCARFRVGHSFELDNHHDAGMDGKYLITGIEHRVGRPVSLDHPESEVRTYFAKFTAIPLDVAYRPEKVTPWPRITGVMHAHIEADGSGDFAEIDPEGRYKVKFPFDTSAVKGLASSRWVRMAEPYAGAGYGLHHPLHKGTEVLLTHIDGDPDRPIISAAVPNPHTKSPVVDANATQSVMQTASGVRVEIEDRQN